MRCTALEAMLGEVSLGIPDHPSQLDARHGRTRLASSVGSASVADDAGTAEGNASPGASAPASHDWQFSFAPYLWVSDLSADASFGDVTMSMEPHVKDLLSDVEIGLMGQFDAYHVPSRLSFSVDSLYLRLSNETEAGPFRAGAGPFSFPTPGLQMQVGPFTVDTPPGPMTLGPFDVDTGPVSATVPRVEFPVGPFEIEQTLTQVAVRGSLGYRVLDRPLTSLLGSEATDDSRRLRADLYAGGRFWYMKVRVEVEYPPIEIPGFTIRPELTAYPRITLPSATFPGATFGGADVDLEESAWWVDPLVGARMAADLRDQLALVLNGNVGGFGIGSASHFSWEVLGLLTWRSGEHWSAAAGWHALDVDRRAGSLRVDVLLHGPVLGLIYRFP